MSQIIDIFILLIFYLFSLFSAFNHERLNSNKHLVVFLWCMFISIFLAFRSIGLDLEPYRNIFESFDSNYFQLISISDIFSGRIEPLFSFLIVTLKTYSLSFNWFLLISGIIPIIIVMKTLNKEVEDSFFICFSFFMLIYFLRGPVDTIRGFAAASMYLYALSSLSRKSYFKFFLKILISISLHYSAVIVFLVYPLLKIRWSLGLYILTSFIMIFLGIIISVYISNIEIDISSNLHPIVFKIIYYLGLYNRDAGGGYQYLNTAHFVLFWLLNLSFTIIIVFNTLHVLAIKKIKISSFKLILLNSQIIGTLLYFFFISLGATDLGTRILFFLSVGSFILIADVTKKGKGVNNNYIFYLILISANIIINFSYYAGLFNPQSPFNIFG